MGCDSQTFDQKKKLHKNEMLTFLKSQSITSDRTKIRKPEDLKLNHKRHGVKKLSINNNLHFNLLKVIVWFQKTQAQFVLATCMVLFLNLLWSLWSLRTRKYEFAF